MKYPIRSLIRTSSDYSFLSLDLSAAEAWIVAALAQDANMMRELQAKTIHEYAASLIFGKPKHLIDEGERYVGKKGNHSLNYRTKPSTLADSINLEGIISVTDAQAKVYYDNWHSGFNVKYWWAEIDTKIGRDRTLITPYKRKRIFYGFINDDLLKEATAYVPQSTVGDHMMGAVQSELGIEGGILTIFNRIARPSKGDIRLIQTAYDSVLIECPQTLLQEVGEWCIDILTRPLIVNGQTITIPVDCDVYPERWGENKYKFVRR